MPDVEEAEDLYGLAPEEFTAARDALARRLRAAKDRDGADAVKKLRRPSALAWALNQAARTDADLIEAALVAGEELRDAMSHGDGGRIREAERSLRQATEAAVEAAGRVLADSGSAPTDDARSRMAATVRAAIVDPDVAVRLRTGTLDRDVEFAGLGVDDMVVAASPKPAKPKPKPPPKPTAGGTQQEAKADKQAEREAEREERRKHEEARRAARNRLAESEADADRLARRAERLAAVADRVEQEAQEARSDADEAKAEAEAAAERVAAAKAELDKL